MSAVAHLEQRRSEVLEQLNEEIVLTAEGCGIPLAALSLFLHTMRAWPTWKRRAAAAAICGVAPISSGR